MLFLRQSSHRSVDYVCRKMVCNKLRRIGEGCWAQDGSTDWVGGNDAAGCDGLELYRTKWCG